MKARRLSSLESKVSFIKDSVTISRVVAEHVVSARASRGYIYIDSHIHLEPFSLE